MRATISNIARLLGLQWPTNLLNELLVLSFTMQQQYFSKPILLFWIALLQKFVTVFLVLNMLLMPAIINFRLQDNPVTVTVLGVLITLCLLINLLSIIPVFALSIIVYRPLAGIGIGFFCLIPCIGWLIQIVLLRETNNDLRQAGLDVGIFGAKLSEVNEKVSQELNR